MTSNQPTEFPEVEYANKHIKEIEELESYNKKHRNITNKLLDSLENVIEQLVL